MKTLVAILVLAPACPLLAASDLADTLKDQYQKHILILRTPFQKGDQEFDSAGKPFKQPPSNQWRAYGPLLITRIKAEKNKLRLEGVRVCSTRDLKPAKEMLLQSGKTVKVDIHLDRPLSSADDAHAILDRIFFLDVKGAPYSLPEFRRPDDTIPDQTSQGDQAVHKVDQKSVVAPTPVYQPDPDYSDRARDAKYQGTVILGVVVDSSGRVSRVKLLRALGRGLDEKAMEKVEIWKFKPATRNGQPVAVEVNVEVTFNLY